LNLFFTRQLIKIETELKWNRLESLLGAVQNHALGWDGGRNCEDKRPT